MSDLQMLSGQVKQIARALDWLVAAGCSTFTLDVRDVEHSPVVTITGKRFDSPKPTVLTITITHEGVVESVR